MPLNYSDMKGRHGAERAVEINVNLPDGRRTYSDTWVLVEGDTGMVHVLNREGTKHLASFPLAATSLVWDDMTELSR